MRHPKVFNLPELPPGFLLRHSYSWVPSWVSIGPDDSVRFIEHINMLPRSANTESIYVGFEKVLQKMLPSFRALGVLPMSGTPTKIQVVR
jgi:hypothetical protein